MTAGQLEHPLVAGRSWTYGIISTGKCGLCIRGSFRFPVHFNLCTLGVIDVQYRHCTMGLFHMQCVAFCAFGLIELGVWTAVTNGEPVTKHFPLTKTGGCENLMRMLRALYCALQKWLSSGAATSDTPAKEAVNQSLEYIEIAYSRVYRDCI